MNVIPYRLTTKMDKVFKIFLSNEQMYMYVRLFIIFLI